MEELVSGLQGPPGIPGRGRPGRPGPPGRIGHTGICMMRMTGGGLCYPLLLCFEFIWLSFSFFPLFDSFIQFVFWK